MQRATTSDNKRYRATTSINKQQQATAGNNKQPYIRTFGDLAFKLK